MCIKKAVLPALWVALTMLTGCSAMLIGEGNADSPPIGSDSRGPTQVAADDALADAVSSAIAASELLQPENVAVSARSGTVTLGGTISSFDARDKAVQVASAVPGVTRVNNQLRVSTGN